MRMRFFERRAEVMEGSDPFAREQLDESPNSAKEKNGNRNWNVDMNDIYHDKRVDQIPNGMERVDKNGNAPVRVGLSIENFFFFFGFKNTLVHEHGENKIEIQLAQNGVFVLGQQSLHVTARRAGSD